MVSDAIRMLNFLKRPNFDELVYRAIERHAGISHKNKSAIVCEYDMAWGEKSLKEALLGQAWENIQYDCVGEKFFLDDGDQGSFREFTLPPSLVAKAQPYKFPYGDDDSDNGRLCIERNEVYLAVREAAENLQETDDEDEDEDDEE